MLSFYFSVSIFCKNNLSNSFLFFSILLKSNTPEKMFMSANTVTTPIQQPTHQQLQQSFSANNLISNLNNNNSNKGGGGGTDPPLNSGSGNGSASKDRKRKRTTKDKDSNSNNAPTPTSAPLPNVSNQNNCNDILGK